jgi:hypothetical protein
MFRFIKILWLLPVCFILYACPYESPVALDARPTEPVDTNLCGYWYGIVKDGSDFFGIEALDIKKLSDSTYDIIRYGKAIKGDMILPDTSHFTGFTSRVDSQLYMNVEATIVEVIQKPKNKTAVVTSKAFYLATLDRKHDTLTVQTITDGFSGKNPNFRNPDALRNTVSSLSKQGKNIFDDVYKLSYRKTKKIW